METQLLSDSLEALYTRLGLAPESPQLLARYSQLSEFLIKHLEYFVYVVVRICFQQIPGNKLDPQLRNITQLIQASEELLKKFDIY